MASYANTTWADILPRITDKVGNNSTFWTNAEKLFAFNEALKVWQALVGEWGVSVNVSCDGNNFYTTPSQVVSIRKIEYNGTPLTMGSLVSFDYGNPDWEGEAVDTPLEWAPDGLSRFAIYPKATSGTLTLQGFSDTMILENPSDALQLGNEELTRLLGYTHHYLTFKEATGEFEASLDELSELFEAAKLRNSRLRADEIFNDFPGRLRDEWLRDARDSHSEIGIR